jgi:hypothetical protein
MTLYFEENVDMIELTGEVVAEAGLSGQNK